MLQCTFGAAPSELAVLPSEAAVSCGAAPVATILDNRPMVNIQPFGMCSALSNPVVAAATAAALGVRTPMPCVPVTAAPWIPGSHTVLVDGLPVLDNASKCMCTWGGIISVLRPGQAAVQNP